MDEVESIVRALRNHRLGMSTELQFQQSVESVLQALGVEHQREKVLDAANRPDFLTASGIAIELKIDGSRNGVLRQLLRYSESANVSSVILVTTRSKHLKMPQVIGGKPLYVHHAVSL